ncbi:nucleotidyltransferase family protein [uncultured Methylobacterium sp.]|uniref:nucleotidyltransferase family protein n=1 Tax=uncultured Methylobacterium sp. TaxID=157278 RepID=UPI002618B194|nr:nucleotidyltransferase family protein [uncultured Methylobacterium sp.]
MREVGIVVLAAGRGTRFGAAPKLLAPLDGRPLVRHAAEAAVAARLGPVVAVLGHEAERVAAALDGLALRTVLNPLYAGGLSTSVRAGLAALPDAIAAAIVLLGDMPRVTPDLLRGLAAAHAGADPAPAAVIPVRDGRRGNPVLIDRRGLSAAIAALSGDRGLGPLLTGRGDVLEWPVASDGVLADVDTPEALARLPG